MIEARSTIYAPDLDQSVLLEEISSPGLANNEPSCSHEISDARFDECNANDESNPDRFNEDIRTIILKKMVHFYCKPNTPISNASEISLMLKDIVDFTTESLKEQVSKCSTLEEVQKLVNGIELDDQQFRSTYMFKKHLQDSEVYFQPQKFVIQHTFVHYMGDMDNEFNMDTYHGIVMPIEDQIRTFLQLPGMLEAILENQEQYCSESVDRPITHFCQGKLWKDTVNRNIGKKIIPIMLYNDDFKIDDSTGPHSGDNAMSGFYYQFPSLPNHLKSKLQYIFVAMLTLAKHVKECTPDSALYMLVHIFTRMEVKGINVLDKSGKEHTIHFILTNLQGDNLGIQTIFGFASFNSNFYCRFCLTPKSICKHIYDSNGIELRSIDG